MSEYRPPIEHERLSSMPVSEIMRWAAYVEDFRIEVQARTVEIEQSENGAETEEDTWLWGFTEDGSDYLIKNHETRLQHASVNEYIEEWE